MDIDKRIQYIIILDLIYIIVYLISMVSLIPEIELIQRGVIIILFSGCIYFVIRISQAFWESDFFMSNKWIFYISRIMFIIWIFMLHLTLMHTSLTISGNMMISQKLIETVKFQEEKVSFYIYDDNNFTTSIAIRNSFLPVYKKILSSEIISPENITITSANNSFIISDGDYAVSYERKSKKKSQKHN